jgi:Spy/CpxP family protein refolding chaperone
MKSKLLSVGLLAVAMGATIGSAGMSFAQASDAAPAAGATAPVGPGGPHGDWEGHRRGEMGFLSRKLNLTEAQRAQIKTIFEAQRATMRPVMQQMAQNRAAMLTATAGGAFDQAKVQAIAAQQAQLEAQLTVQRKSVESQIYNTVLTSEQKATAEQMRQKALTRINERIQKSTAGTEAPTEQQ